MNWIAAAVLGIGLYVRWRQWQKRCGARPQATRAGTGEPSPADVAKALEANHLEGMEPLLRRSQDPLTRHTLMTHMAAVLYKGRKENNMRRRFKEVAERYATEFEALIGPRLRATRTDMADEAPLFKWLAIVLEEEGDYDSALTVCEQALAWNLRDGTKTGYEGRILRIEKKRHRSRTS